MPLGKQFAGMWTLTQQMQARAASTWTGIPAVPSMWSWGRAHVGQMGTNVNFPSPGGSVSSPVQVDSGVTWSYVALDSQNTAAIKSDGTLWLWGGNAYGALGLGDTSDLFSRSSPTQLGTDTNWAMVSLGYKTGNAIKTNGTLWSWGQNSVGEAGINNTTGKSSPVQVGALTTWAKVMAGVGHTVAIKTDGTMWSWGNNAAGQVGDNTIVNKSSPVQLGAGTSWANLAGHKSGPIAQKTDGSIWTWGLNAGDNSGILALNDAVNRSSPVQIGADTDWILSGSHNAASASSFLIKTNGSLWGFGYNNYGMLGIGGPVTKKSSPVQVGALTNWSNTAVTSNTGFQVKTDGTLWSAGNGADYGQLGNNLGGVSSYRSSPVQIGTGTQWTDVYGGFQHVVALQEIPGT